MSDPQNAPGPSAELDSMLSASQRDLQSEISKSREQASALSAAVPDRQKKMQESLARARAFYGKKDFARAFAEWEEACAFLEEGDAFRRKIATLRESHQNLLKANRELAEIKEILRERSAPPAEHRQFVHQAHEGMSGQVKDAYSRMSRELRAERVPRAPSFTWPAALAVSAGLLAAVAIGFSGYQVKARLAARAEAEQAVERSRLELVVLQSERDEIAKKHSAMKAEYEKKIQELKQQNEGWRNAGRDKIAELEMQLQETERKNRELKKMLEDLTGR